MNTTITPIIIRLLPMEVAITAEALYDLAEHLQYDLGNLELNDEEVTDLETRINWIHGIAGCLLEARYEQRTEER